MSEHEDENEGQGEGQGEGTGAEEYELPGGAFGEGGGQKDLQEIVNDYITSHFTASEWNALVADTRAEGARQRADEPVGDVTARAGDVTARSKTGTKIGKFTVQSFDAQPEHVKASFYAVYGDKAPEQWSSEHTAELHQLETSPYSTNFFKDTTPVSGLRAGAGNPTDLGGLRRALHLANFGGNYWDTEGAVAAFNRAASRVPPLVNGRPPLGGGGGLPPGPGGGLPPGPVGLPPVGGPIAPYPGPSFPGRPGGAPPGGPWWPGKPSATMPLANALLELMLGRGGR